MAAYTRNREHLARWDPARPDFFYSEAGQAEQVATQVAERESGKQHPYVLWHGDVAVGRVTINNIVRGVLQSGTVGYWLDHEHLGKGLATGMVEHMVEEAERLGLHRLEAGTMLRNEPSQAVLRRAGFTFFGMAERFLYINGTWEDHVLFQRILNDRPAGNHQP